VVRDAVHAFDVLRQVLRRMHGRAAAKGERVELDALFIGSTMHGLAGVMNGSCVDKLDLKTRVLERAMPHVMERIGQALGSAKR
jgi:predicted Zn-dependent protease